MALAAALQSEHCRLTSLDLGSNGLKRTTGVALAKALKSEHCHLTSLSLFNNVYFCSQPVVAALYSERCRLTSLNLEANGLEDDAGTALRWRRYCNLQIVASPALTFTATIWRMRCDRSTVASLASICVTISSGRLAWRWLARSPPSHGCELAGLVRPTPATNQRYAASIQGSRAFRRGQHREVVYMYTNTVQESSSCTPPPPYSNTAVLHILSDSTASVSSTTYSTAIQ